MVVEAVEAKAEQTITTTQVENEDAQGNATAKQEESAAIPNEVTDAKKNGADQTTADEGNADDGGRVVSTQEKKDDADKSGEASPSYSGGDDKGEFPDENGLKGYEMKALTEFKSRLQEALLMRNLFEKKKEPEADHEKEKEREKEKEKEEEKEKSNEQESEKEDKLNEQESSKDTSEDIKDAGEKQSAEDKGKAKMVEESNQMEIDENSKLWGVPLLPSKGDAATDTILMKFLKAREFKVNDAMEMLKNTLKWRIQNNIDSILEEDLGSEYDDMAYMSGIDREGHPICFNLYGAFGDDEFYNRTFGTPESIEKFLRWRVRLMEKEIQNLDFKPGGISSLLQINDLKDTPGPARKDIRLATKNAVSLLENNYPEFVTRNVTIFFIRAVKEKCLIFFFF